MLFVLVLKGRKFFLLVSLVDLLYQVQIDFMIALTLIHWPWIKAKQGRQLKEFIKSNVKFRDRVNSLILESIFCSFPCPPQTRYNIWHKIFSRTILRYMSLGFNMYLHVLSAVKLLLAQSLSKRGHSASLLMHTQQLGSLGGRGGLERTKGQLFNYINLFCFGKE